MAGATVVLALLGFGRTAHQHRRHLLEDERSLVIEIVDEDSRVRDFAENLTDLTGIGLITIEAVEVLFPTQTAIVTDDKD